jgi:hypothetical protein
VVRFELADIEHTQAAAHETDRANRAKVPHLGSPVLYTAIRGALLSKAGVGKGWSEDEEPQNTERNHDQPDDAFAARDHGAFLPVLLAA